MMTNNLQELLAVLATLAPDVCEQMNATIFKIKVRSGNTIFARNIYTDEVDSQSHLEDMFWLQGALQRAIEARGWDYNHHTSITKGEYHFVTIYKSGNGVGFHSENNHCKNTTEPLLAALIAALKGE